MTADFTRPDVEPWWADVDKAPRCPSCGTRLDRPGRPCPLECGEAS